MPKIVDHQARRASLMDRAEAAFATHGYAALGMRELARELNVSTGTLYHYFPSKQALFDALAEHVVSRDIQGLAAVSDGLPLAARLQALMQWVEANEASYASQFMVMLEGARMQGAEGDGLRASLWRSHQRYVEVAATALGLPMSEAAMVVHALTGLMLQRLLDGGRTPLAPLLEALKRWLEPRTSEEI